MDSNLITSTTNGLGLCLALPSGLCAMLCAARSPISFNLSQRLAHYTCFQIDYIGIGMNALGNSILCYYLTGTKAFYNTVGQHFFTLNIVFSFFTCAGCAIAKLRYKRPYPSQRKDSANVCCRFGEFLRLHSRLLQNDRVLMRSGMFTLRHFPPRRMFCMVYDFNHILLVSNP